MKIAVENILDYHFPITGGHEVVILCDQTKMELAEALCQGIRTRQGWPVIIKLGEGNRSPRLIERLLQDDKIGLIALVSAHMWAELGLAQYFAMVEEKPTLKARCHPIFFDCVMPLDSLLRVYSANYAEDLPNLEQMQLHLQPFRHYHLSASGGTEMRFIAREWKVDKYTEIRTSPLEDSINGKIVVDGSIFCARVNVPIELTIEKGRIVQMNCANPDDLVFQQYVNFMEQMLHENSANWQLAEVGLGICSTAKFSGVIMEDEAVKGSAHFCFGENTMYGGTNESSFHGGTVVIKNVLIEKIP